MAIITRKEFAEQCGDKVTILNVYIQRGKVTTHGDKGKYIDTENAVNMAYLEDRRFKNGLLDGTITPPKVVKQVKKPDKQTLQKPVAVSKTKKPTVKTKTPVKKPEKIIPEKVIPPVDPEKNARDSQRIRQVMTKTDKELELLQLNIEKSRLQLEKTAGKLLPIDLIHDVHKRYARNIFVNFENGCENIASKFCNIMASGDMEMYGRIMEDLRKELNRCITTAGVETTQDIDRLIDDYSETRARGERGKI